MDGLTARSVPCPAARIVPAAVPDAAASSPSPTPGGRGGRFSVRLLIVAAAGQLGLVAAVVVVAINGFPFIGGGDDPRGRAASSASVPTPTIDRFDARRAMRIAKLQIDAGPRPAGSKALRRVAVKLRAMLPSGRFEPVPGHPRLRNIVGELPGPGPVIVIGAHYDTINRPKGFVGANDSAAAVGAVVELSRALTRIRRSALAPGIRFVLFDGEEEPRPTDDFYRDALRGSKAYVQAHAEEVRAMLLLDYIGNKDLRLPREGTSSPSLWQRVRTAADDVGVAKVFPDRVDASILDDHTPFLRAGIPAVDFIDWGYRYQHTLRDTYDKLSVGSVDAVGETVVQLIDRWPAESGP